MTLVRYCKCLNSNETEREFELFFPTEVSVLSVQALDEGKNKRSDVKLCRLGICELSVCFLQVNQKR